MKALRAAGASVEILAQCGKGVPDLLVGITQAFGIARQSVERKNLLLEVKDPSKPKADQCLTPDQVEWHRNWKGQVAIVYSVADALRVIGVSS